MITNKYQVTLNTPPEPNFRAKFLQTQGGIHDENGGF